MVNNVKNFSKQTAGDQNVQIFDGLVTTSYNYENGDQFTREGLKYQQLNTVVDDTESTNSGAAVISQMSGKISKLSWILIGDTGLNGITIDVILDFVKIGEIVIPANSLSGHLGTLAIDNKSFGYNGTMQFKVSSASTNSCSVSITVGYILF